MGYDIHISKSKKEASYLSPELSLDDGEHSDIFITNKVIVSSYPCLSRMNDQYSDAQYEGDEILVLRKELTFIIQQTPDIELLHSSFEELIEVCDKAIKKNEQIYCFCD